MKNINLYQDNNSTGSEEKWSILDNLNDLKDNSSIRSSNNFSIFRNPNYIKLDSKTLSYIFPLVYFFTSTLFLFILLFVNLYKDKNIKDTFEKSPMHPFPGLDNMKQIQPQIFSACVLITSISGFLNVWFFCALLMQRFSVPELKSNKLMVHLMFILGIFGNIIYIFFGFSPEILKLESQHLKYLQISVSMIIFLSFVFFNILFATLTLKVFDNFRKKITPKDKRLRRNIKMKKMILYLTIFICIVYLIFIFLNYHLNIPHTQKPHHEIKDTLNLVKVIKCSLFLLPYILFVLNAIINLTYYFDIRYIDDVINIIIDREFFLSNEESSMLISNINI